MLLSGECMKIVRAVAAVLLLAASWVAISAAYDDGPASEGHPQYISLNDRWASFLGEDNSPIRDRAAAEISLPALQQLLQSSPYKKPDLEPEWAADSNETQETNSEAVSGRSKGFAKVLVPLAGVDDSRIILDISPEPSEYIPVAIGIPYTEFLQSGGALKNVSEMAAILGGAGISRDDAVLIYGECQPCGGGPSAAAYVYWIMKYLGHENLTLLDGGIDDWVAAGEPTAASSSHLVPVNYTPEINGDLLAEYEFVKSGSAQIIDARTADEFEAGSISGSMNIPYEGVLDGKRIKDETDLEQLFSSLDKEKPVVVYTNTGVKASMVWLALTLLGYEARIYSWKEWQSSERLHQQI